jgi:hypothetical protein
MALLTSTAPRLIPPPQPELASTRAGTVPAATRWPVESAARWVLRLVFAVPYVVLAVLAYSHEFADSSNANLVERGNAIDWGSANLSFISQIYPPLPTVVAALVPSALALGMIGALGAGTILEVVGCRLARRGYPLWAILILVAALGASPGFALTATSDLASLMTLTLLALALDSFVRFAFRGFTHAGFLAGLAVGLAALCSPVAVLCAIGFAIAAPLIASHRFRDQPSAGNASAAVLLFPTFAGLAGWTFICWRFRDDPLVWLRTSAPGIWDRQDVVSNLEHTLLPVMLAPIFVLAVVLLIVRGHMLSAIGICIPLLAVSAAVYLGLPFAPAATAVILGVIGLVSLPARPGRGLLAVILVVALCGLAAKWAYPASAVLNGWEHAVEAAFNSAP